MNYQDMLKILAAKKLAQQNSDQVFDNPQPEQQGEPMNISPPSTDDDEEDETDVASNKRIPASKDRIPNITGKDDVQLIQGLGIMDKIHMKRQGLDPWNPDHVRQYKRSQGV